MATLNVNIDKPPIPTGNTLWVDAVNGNPATATPGRQDLPYLTLTAAKNAASSGDLVHVRPGTYNEKNLLKNGVNWYFEPGASVVYTGATDGSIFDDSASGANAAVSCTVYGSGAFTWTNDFGAATQSFGVVHIVNPASVVVINGRSINQLGNNFQYGWTVLQEDGLLTINLSEKMNSPNGAYNMGWYGGTGYFNFPEYAGGQITWAGTDVGGDWHINCDNIALTASDIGIFAESIDTVGALWVNAQLISGSFSNGVMAGSSGKVYVTAQKIWQQGGAGTGPVLAPSGGKWWITSQKMTSASGRFFTCEGGSPVVHLDVQQYENELAGEETSTYGAIYNEGADLIVHGGVMTITNAGEEHVGLNHVSGTTRAKGLVIDLSGNDQATSYPVNVSGAGLVLDGCTLIAPSGTDSVSATSSQTIEARASTANNAVDANVTIEGSLQIEAGAATVGQVPIATARGTWAWGAIPDASETTKGIIEIATAAEVAALTDATRAVTPANLKSGALIDVTPSFINYTGGNQATTNTALDDVHSSAGWDNIAPGFYEFQIYVLYNANATTTGARFSINGTVTQDFFSLLISYSTVNTDRSTFQTSAFDGGATAISSVATTANNAILTGNINVTVLGNLRLRFSTEIITTTTITVTSLIGFIRRVS